MKQTRTSAGAAGGSAGGMRRAEGRSVTTGCTRGRPRSFDREEALQAALGVFWRYGYDASSLSELTSAMGITPPSLYAAFGSKKELFLESVELYARTSGAQSADALLEPTALGAVTRLLKSSAESFCGPENPHGGCFVVLAAVNCSPESADVVSALRDIRRASEKAIRDRIVRGIREGELPKGTDAASLAKFYGAVVQGMSVQARDGASRKELEGIVAHALTAWPTSRDTAANGEFPRRGGKS